MQSIGEVKECGHCKGTGFRNGGKNSCRKCSFADGHDECGIEDVSCSACGGKGSVWIGPDIVQVRVPIDELK
jgi:RecJ-like exonuclease